MPELQAIHPKLAEWYDQLVAFLPNLILIAVILILTMIVSKRTQGLVRRLSARTQAPSEIIDLIGRLARFTVIAFGLLLALGELGLSGAVLSFITGLGITGIIIGFALQDIVKQFAAGVLLLMLRPFRIGDDVKIGEFEGRVMEVQLRATVLKTEQGDEVLIPNADVYTTAITNLSRYSPHRHDITLSVPLDSNIVQVGAALTQAISKVTGIMGSPAPSVVATSIEDQKIKLEVRFWVDAHTQLVDSITTNVAAAISQSLAQIAEQQYP